MVFTWKVTGINQVWRQDGPNAFPVQLTGGDDSTTIQDITPDDRWIVVHRDRGGEENPGVYLQSIEGGPLREVQHKPKVQTQHQFVSDDGKSLYYRANDIEPTSYAIYRYDIATGKREAVFTEPGNWTVDDHRGSRLLLSKAIGSLHNEIHELDLKTGKRTPLLGVGRSDDYDAAYGAADDTVIVRTNEPGEYYRVYAWKAGALTPISPEIKHDVEAMVVDPAHTRVVYSVNENGYTRTYALDARTFKPLKLALPAADNQYPAPTSRDGRFAIVLVDSTDLPPTEVVWDWKTRTSKTWRHSSSPEIDLKTFARPTLETYPARDGTPVPMFVYRPASCAQGGCPVIVNFHGGPESQSAAGFLPTAQLFVDAGFVFVRPNVRGSSGYGKTWIDADNGPRRLDVVTDIEDCARHIRASWGKDGKAPRVGVYGGSYGGYSTLMAMTYFAGAYDAGVSVVGIADLVTFLTNTAPYRRALRANEYGDLEKDRDALVKLSPTTYIDRLKAPLLLIQGLNDPRVPVGESVLMRDRLAARGVTADLIIYPDEGHGVKKRANEVTYLAATLAFFQKHLQGAP